MRPLVLLSSLEPGGAERVTVDFLRHLATCGQPVPVCTLTNRHDGFLAEELRKAGVHRIDLGARRLLDPLVLLRLVGAIRRDGIDLVHAHGQDATIMASWLQVATGLPLVVTRHVLEEPGDTARERWRAALALRGMAEAQTTVAVSRAAAARLETLASIPPSRLRVIRNGIALDRFDPGRLSSLRCSLRASLGFGETDRLVLFPAALRPGKGHDVLLAAVSRLRESCPRAQVLFAGEGALRRPLENAAAPLGRAVRFLGARDDVPELMCAADLVVLPSLSEALPTVAMEAAAAGTAIVASRVGGVPEVVIDGVTGTLVPPGEPDPLSRAVADLLLDSDRRLALGAAGRRRALRDFGMDTQVARTVELWWDVMGGRGRSG